MYVPVRAIVTRVVRYSDSQSIVTLYTRERGRLSCLSPAGATREARRRRAILMPLSVVEGVVDIRPGRELYAIRDLRAARPMHELTVDPSKGAVAMFVAEVAATALREPTPDPGVYALLEDTALTLAEATRGVANMHICFLMRLTRMLGVEPDWESWRPGWVLDLVEGNFRPDVPAHGRYLPAVEAAAARELSRINPRNAHLYRMSGDDRNLIVDRVIAYFGLHDVKLAGIKSLDILRQIF